MSYIQRRKEHDANKKKAEENKVTITNKGVPQNLDIDELAKIISQQVAQGGQGGQQNTISKEDMAEMAKEMAKEVAGNIKITGGGAGGVGGISTDTFDNKASLEKLADAMIMQNGKETSNFEELGDVKKTKKDVDSTIDLLSDLDD